MFKDLLELLMNGETSLKVVILVFVGDILAGFVRDMFNIIVSNKLSKRHPEEIPKDILECKAMLKDFKKCRRRLCIYCYLAKHLKSKKLKAHFANAAKSESVLYRKYINKFRTDIPPNDKKS